MMKAIKEKRKRFMGKLEIFNQIEKQVGILW